MSVQKDYWFTIQGKIYATDEDDAYEQLTDMARVGDNCERAFFEVDEDKSVEEVIKVADRLDELEQKAWEKMTGEVVAEHLSKEEAEEYYSLLGVN